ncbi:glutamine ABC transporter ATP-binding protein [Variovorax sp. J22R133]|uniref:sugar phosphate isomerase/epimerase family protein n=1 Tax=Variovorax brevis TaxID=3053503 RepID=UPI00257701F8|nr:glutamine ABC transporter ATP-binding protein [Variovorax sp. J22R133]MDM0113056.1 glutamine ABC transporter ATP-binding protein [Variovorax sp. J22R133]
MPPILISLAAFGAAEVGRHGQAWFARLSREAGADSVEVRGELLRGSPTEVDAQLATLAEFTSVYSEPEGLWTEGGDLNTAALERGLARAAMLEAPRLKMSIGGFGAASHASLSALKHRLAATDTELLIENDQSVSAGSVPALLAFFDAADRSGLELGMTFDMGNWHYVGECPLQAAQALGPRVRYVHCKGAQRLPHKWVAVPLSHSLAPWRAILRALPSDVPHAIEYPLVGDDLLAVTRDEIAQVRAACTPLT